ncbi:unnamed protein product [Arctogadus glacialis]
MGFSPLHCSSATEERGRGLQHHLTDQSVSRRSYGAGRPSPASETRYVHHHTVTASVSVSLLDLCFLSQHPSVHFFPHFLSLCRRHAQRTEASPSWRSRVWDLQCCSCCYSMGLL